MSTKVNAPPSSARTLASLLLISSMAAMSSSTAFAGQVLGFGFPYGPVYSIDAVTGNTVVVAPAGVLSFAASPSPVPGQFFIETNINLWTEDVFGGSTTPLGALDLPAGGFVDLAYDPTAGTLYTAGPDGLYTIDYSCPTYLCTATLVAPLLEPVDAIDFVPGMGLYGVANTLTPVGDLLFRIDPLTGKETLVGPGLGPPPGPIPPGLGIPPGDGVMAFAYDGETDSFVASVLAGVAQKTPSLYFDYPSSGMLYSIDRNTGVATLLNGNAPTMLALAEDVPEPSTGVLLPSAIAALLLARRLTQRGRCLHRLCRRMANSQRRREALEPVS
jgi:hypothetical protein